MQESRICAPRRLITHALVLGVTVLALNVNAGAQEESLSPQQLAAQSALLQQQPLAKFFQSDSRITRVYGTTLSSGSSPQASAEQFRLNHAGLFGVAPDDLQPLSLLEDNRHTQPVGYNRQTGDYKFTLVYYTQFVREIPVFRADLKLLVRNEADSPLVLASSGLRALGAFQIGDDLRADVDDAEYIQSQFALGQKAVLADSPKLINFSQPEVVVWAGLDDMKVAPQVGLVFIADDTAPDGTMNEKWLYITDIDSGAILHRESGIIDVDVPGTVSGNSTQGAGSEQCEPEEVVPMPYASVSIGATSVFADENGAFVIPNGGSDPVTVDSPIRGEWFEVFNFAGPETVLSLTRTPPDSADFVHNGFNFDPLVRAEVNGYVHANVIRDMVLVQNPDYPTLQNTEFPVTVNRTDGFCPGNAWYDPGEQSINFCQEGGGSPNTSWTSVIYHEYGHHLVAAAGSGQGAYGEGTGDVMSVIILDDPRLGFGFFGDCSSSLRNADNNCQYSASSCSTCGSAIHTCGQLISGCVWDTRNELIVTEPENYLDILQYLAVNSILLHSGSSITPQITIDWLTLDDDDDNIGNGTPHYQEICAGFGAHGMDCPELDAVIFVYPQGRPQFVSPGQTTTIPVDVEGVADDPVPGTGTVSYRIGSSGLFTTEAMNEISTNQYEATLPAADCTQVIQYYFGVQSAGFGLINDPADAPGSLFEATAASGTTIAFEDNFESDLGWTVTNNVADGQWERGVPISGCNRGNPPTDADGSGQCFVTDNSAADACNSDVDNGSTTMESPIMDASGGGLILTYDRWYSNVEGSSPMQDIFTVQISDNGGLGWIDLEIVGPGGTEVSGGWVHKEFNLDAIPGFEPNDQFRVRFIASDTDPQSVVEAGVDAVMLMQLECEVLCAGDLDGSGGIDAADLALLLGAWGPSADPADLNGDGVVDANDLALLLGSWGACP